MWLVLFLIIVIIFLILSKKRVEPPNTLVTQNLYKERPIKTDSVVRANKEIFSHVAGIPHRLGKNVDLNSKFHSGMTLLAQREYGNPYDKNTIKLFLGSRFVGYIAKIDNTSIARHMDSGNQVSVKVTKVDDTDPWHGVKIRVTYEN